MKKDISNDPRWSRNLQIIQSKIAVFEDLSDRTEIQVKQITTMMENKICELQSKIDEANTILNKITSSMKKSIEVAQIFEDKIPHEEIIERQNTLKFVKAALLAHEGKSEEEIAQIVDLPKSQIDFIVKVNAERLSFDPEQMPDWIRNEIHKDLTPKAKSKTSLRPLDQILKQSHMSLEFSETRRSNSKESMSQNINSHDESSQDINQIRSQMDINHHVESNQEKKGVVVNSIDLSSLNSKSMSADLPLSGSKKASSASEGMNDKKIEALVSGRIKNLGVRPVVFPRIEVTRR